MKYKKSTIGFFLIILTIILFSSQLISPSGDDVPLLKMKKLVEANTGISQTRASVITKDFIAYGGSNVGIVVKSYNETSLLGTELSDREYSNQINHMDQGVNYFAAIDMDGRVKVYRNDGFSVVWDKVFSGGSQSNHLDFDSTGNQLAIASGSWAYVYDASTGDELYSYQVEGTIITAVAVTNNLLAISVWPHGNKDTDVKYENTQILIIDTTTDQILVDLERRSRMRAMDFTVDDTLLVGGVAKFGLIEKPFNSSTQVIDKTDFIGISDIVDIDASPNDQVIMIAGDHAGLYDLANEKINPFWNEDTRGGEIAPSGDYLIANTFGGIRIYAIERGASLNTLPPSNDAQKQGLPLSLSVIMIVALIPLLKHRKQI